MLQKIWLYESIACLRNYTFWYGIKIRIVGSEGRVEEFALMGDFIHEAFVLNDLTFLKW